jgi:hypothetical protein
MKNNLPTAETPFAILLRGPAGKIMVERVRVLDRFDALGAAYVETVNGQTPHFLPYTRLASSLDKTRAKVRAFRLSRRHVEQLSFASAPLNAAACQCGDASGLDGPEACLI